MYKTHGIKDRYFKCNKCGSTVLITHIKSAETKKCDDCGGALYETNPYKSKIKY